MTNQDWGEEGGYSKYGLVWLLWLSVGLSGGAGFGVERSVWLSWKETNFRLLLARSLGSHLHLVAFLSTLL